MKKANRIVSFDWTMYDQGHVVYRPAQMSGDELRLGQSQRLRELLFAVLDRQPLPAARQAASRAMGDLQSVHAQGSQTENIDSIAAPTAEPDVAPMPPILPIKREWRAAVLEAAGGPGPHMS